MLQPQNILLTSGLPRLGDIKLIDFGIARLVQNGDVIRDIVGTPEFVGKISAGEWKVLSQGSNGSWTGKGTG